MKQELENGQETMPQSIENGQTDQAGSTEESNSVNREKKKKNGFLKVLAVIAKGLFYVILFAIKCVIAFFVELIRLIAIAFGGTEFGQGFLDGFFGRESKKKVYTITDEVGSERTLEEVGSGRYRDDTGSYWITDDNGNTFRRED